MRLFGYYAVHSFVNQIKKLFKTWVAVLFAVCLLFGVVIGVLAATVDNAVADDNPEPEEIEEVEPLLPYTMELDDGTTYIIESKNVSSAVICLIIITVAALLIVFSDKTAIFNTADVNLLFSSPLTPQKVLLFRLATQSGLLLIAVIYGAIYAPSFADLLGVSYLQSGLAVGGVVLAIISSVIIKSAMYIVGSISERAKKNVKYGVYAALILIALGFVAYWKLGPYKNSVIASAIEYFAHPVINYIPILGWCRGASVCAIDGNYILYAVYALVTVLGLALMLFLVSKIKADFYEDAMAKSEEVAEMQRKMQEKSGGLRRSGFGPGVQNSDKPKKNSRLEEVANHNMKHGKGADVFFFRPLYNRWKFSRFHFDSATMWIYLAILVFVSAIMRFAAGVTDLFVVPALVCAVLVFYVSIGNPLSEEFALHYIYVIPESTAKKLLFSLLVCPVTTLLDCLPGLIVSAILMPTSPLIFIGLLFFILTVNFFVVCVGGFLGISIPENVGANLKIILQVTFVMFGIIPDAAVISIFGVMGHMTAGLIIASVMNVVLGGLFFVLMIPFVEKNGGKPIGKRY